MGIVPPTCEHCNWIMTRIDLNKWQCPKHMLNIHIMPFAEYVSRQRLAWQEYKPVRKQIREYKRS